jgi:hypothetical protein
MQALLWIRSFIWKYPSELANKSIVSVFTPSNKLLDVPHGKREIQVKSKPPDFFFEMEGARPASASKGCTQLNHQIGGSEDSPRNHAYPFPK